MVTAARVLDESGALTHRDVLSLAAAVESLSVHPVAKAITAAAKGGALTEQDREEASPRYNRGEGAEWGSGRQAVRPEWADEDARMEVAFGRGAVEREMLRGGAEGSVREVEAGTFLQVPGRGVSGVVAGRRVAVGQLG